MGEPGVPTRTERSIALGLAAMILDDITNDVETRRLNTHELWLLASTLKYQAETIRAFQETNRG